MQPQPKFNGLIPAAAAGDADVIIIIDVLITITTTLLVIVVVVVVTRWGIKVTKQGSTTASIYVQKSYAGLVLRVTIYTYRL